MKILTPVKTIEVKRAFVVADLISAKEDRRKHLTLVPKDVFIQKLKAARIKGLALKESELDAIIAGGYKKRLKSYDASDWYVAEVKTTEVGVWKRAGGLPLSWTNGSLAETAALVKNAIENNPSLLKKRARYSIPNMLKTNVGLLQREKYLLPIVFKDGTGTNGRRGLKRRMKGDIDDGCMRSVALAVQGAKIIKVYMGFPKKTAAKK